MVEERMIVAANYASFAAETKEECIDALDELCIISKQLKKCFRE